MSFVNGLIFKVIALARLDRLDEAKTEVANALKMDPSITRKKWRELSFYSDPAIVEREIADLAKAGLSE
jgi:hypothetical protein